MKNVDTNFTISQDVLEQKFSNFYDVLLGLNVLGTLDIKVLNIIEDYISGSFGIDMQAVALLPFSEECTPQERGSEATALST